jgi:aminopeptidase N/puromycin-sensitive aminopeptidase
VNAYLRKFAYANATAEDFWTAMTLASGGLPVNKVMPTFVDQAGQPLVSVKSSCITPSPVNEPRRKFRRSRRPIQPNPKTEINLSQQRFWLDPGRANSRELWVIPVCVKAEGAKPFCQIFNQSAQTLPVAGCSSWVFANANASGYYRTQYDSASLQRVIAVATTELTTAERISLLNDEAALLTPGKESVARYLDLIGAISQDAEYRVVESYSSQLHRIDDHLLGETTQTTFRAWIRANFTPMFAKIGWTPASSERPDVRSLRADLVFLLGRLGGDTGVMHRSVDLARAYVQDPHAIDPSIAGAVLEVAAHSNDADLFEGYLSVVRDPASTPEVVSLVAGAMGEFADPQLAGRWLEISASPETRNQDAGGYFAQSLHNVETQRFAWQWIKDHWPQVESKLTTGSGAEIVAAAGNFCDAVMRDDVQKFFSDHKVPSAERTLKQSLEQIDRCIGYREHQQTNMTTWLAQHKETAISGSR